MLIASINSFRILDDTSSVVKWLLNSGFTLKNSSMYRGGLFVLSALMSRYSLKILLKKESPKIHTSCKAGVVSENTTKRGLNISNINTRH